MAGCWTKKPERATLTDSLFKAVAMAMEATKTAKTINVRTDFIVKCSRRAAVQD